MPDDPIAPDVDPASSLSAGEEIVSPDQLDRAPDPVPPQYAFPVAYDDEGNLLPGYQLDENNDPVYVGAGTTATVYGPSQVAPSGAAYDEEGNLLPGYALDPNGNPVYVGGGYVAPATQAQADADRAAAMRDQARQQQTLASQRSQVNNGDWRVKLSLAPQSKYLYNAPQPGILQPLAITGGVIFPFTPTISTAYKANYSNYDLTHSNFRGYFYQNSYVDAVNINATFTAQSTSEADYLLAVIHFFRSATKMFYGQDAERGTPPPLVFLDGLGTYQFNKHPCLIQQFNYTLPAEVDYIRAGSVTNNSAALVTRRERQGVATTTAFSVINRLASAFLTKGAIPNTPAPAQLANIGKPTYVPTKMDIQLTLLPVQTRNQVSKQFSVKEFANGNLLRGGFW